MDLRDQVTGCKGSSSLWERLICCTFFAPHVAAKWAINCIPTQDVKAWQRATSVNDVKPWFFVTHPVSAHSRMTPRFPRRQFSTRLRCLPLRVLLWILLRDCGIKLSSLWAWRPKSAWANSSPCGWWAISLLLTNACGAAGNQEAGQRTIASLKFMGEMRFSQLLRRSVESPAYEAR